MKSAETIERIRRRSFTVGANQPFLLNDPARIFYVEQGHLDVFGIEEKDGAAARRLPFITRVPAGGIAFGAPALTFSAGGVHRIVLQCVPSRDTVVVECDRVGFADAETFDLNVTIWIDEWIFRLSEFLIRDGRQPSRNVRLLEADADVAYPAASVLSAHHSDVIWVSANRPVRFIGRRDLVVEAGAQLPLSERNWLETDVATEVSAAYTPTVAVESRLWPAFDRFSLLVLSYVRIFWNDRAAALRDRYQAQVRTRKATVTRMFHGVGDVLHRKDAPEPSVGGGRTPLQMVVGAVAESLGVTLDVPDTMTAAGDNELEAVTAIARRSGLRTRLIRLEPGWWRRDGPSFAGRETVDGEERPIAVLSDGPGAYRAFDPLTRAAVPVDDDTGARIARYGLMLYAPVPERIEDGTALLRHAARGCGRDLRTVIAMGVCAGLIALLTPWLTGRLLAEIIPRVDVSMWIAALGALLMGAFGNATFGIVHALSMLRIEGRIDERLQSAVWVRLLSLPAPFFRNYTAGDLADRANGITLIRQLMTGATATAVISGIFSVFSFALLFYYSWRLTLVAGGLLLLLLGGTWLFARAQMRHHRAAFEIQGTIDGLVFQMISGIAKLRIAHAETFALARWMERFAEQKRATLAARRWAAGQQTANSMFSPLASLAIFAFIMFQLIGAELQPTFDLQSFIAFNAAFGQFAASMTGLTSAWTTVVTAVPLFERVRPILAARPETSTGGYLPEVAGNIEFANVVFRYLPDVPNAINGVSFEIRKGDYVAFVGPSGSGKSTIYRLMLGFEQPNGGAVFLDGHDLSSLDLPAVRSQMGVVMQNGQLVTASIFRNIASSSALTMDDAWEAARAAGLAEDIEAMPMGMHTVLPEGGIGLSGGQKQRLLIARALARKPRVLLFDEATSALDNRTQEIVQESMRKLSVTRVVIAHRLSTVRNADRIFVLTAGRIVESGRYDDLMARDGVFADLARRQVV